MKRVTWLGGSNFHIEDASDPDGLVLAPHEILLRVKAVGICKTDIHIMEGRLPEVTPPRILGHEISGIVERAGSRVLRVRPGSRVTCDSVVGCGQCDFCHRGSRQFCRNGYEFGFGHDGGCQGFLVMPEENVHPIGDLVSMEEAAILDMEVLAALRKPGAIEGDTVLIIGSGPAGLVATQLAKILGAEKVILSGDTEKRLELGHHLGADRIVDIRREDLDLVIKHETLGRGVDLAMDCAGTSESFAQALESAAPGARVVLYGVYPDPLPEARVLKIVLKNLCVYGSVCDRVGWNDVISWVEQGRLNLRDLITHTFPLEEAPHAYEYVRRGSDELVKAVLKV